MAPDEIRVIFRSESGVALNDSAGDTVRLLTPNGEVWDEESYAAAGPDQAWSRDEAGGWHDDWPPSPGTPNAPPPTPTPTPTPGALQPILISEVLYDGAISGQGDEFVELWNGTGEAVALDGWLIGDEESQGGNEGMYRFPDTTTLGAGEALIVARDAAAFHQRFGTWPDFAFRTSPDPALVPLLDRDTTWASGHWALDDNGDEVLLLDRWQRFVDGLAFRNGDFAAVGLTGHDINASEPRALHHVVGLDSPHVNDWVAKDLPTPRQPYAIPSSAAAPLGPALDGLPVAWGSLHSHSFYSDGSGPPALAFGVARANGMNFMAVSDHSHWFVADEWQTLRQAATAANRPGEFLALAAFEWTHREQGHANVFHTSDYVSRDEAAGATLADFYGWLAARPDARATFNHPFAGQFNNLAYVPSLHPHFVGMEVGNGSGSQQTRYENSYWQALRNGWRIGAMGNLDTETPNWGDDGQLRTGVLLPALGQGDLWAAIEARRTFATEDRNLALAMRAGDVWMGGAMAAGTQRIALWFRDGDGEPMQLQLLRDGVIVAEQSVNAAPAPQRVEVTVDALSGDIFVARAVQSDGQMAWSSPLWVTGTATPQPPQLSEVLSAPRDVDWDGNGIADFNDEWIELHNPHDRAIALGGYRIEVEGFGYTVPAGRTLEAHGYALFFKAETGISLSNYGELVRLVAANGGVVDEVDVPFQGYDLSKARCGDGWQERVVPTPGGPCQPAAGGGGGSAPPPAPQPIAVVRELPEESLATIEGIVTAPPSVFGAKSLYLQDESGGIKLYRYAGLPDLAEGERIRVTGYVKSHFGEIELTVPSSRPVERLGSGEPLLPIALAAGTLGQHAGQLVAVSGTVERWSGAHWRLDDGVESIFIYHDQETGVERPYLNIGETRTVIGIVGWSDYGPRLMPRYERDISDRELITLPIKAARALEAGQPVRVMGVVTAPTGLFDEKVAYLQDDSGGIKLYGTALPDLALGERLVVTGTVRVAFGEVELSVAGAEEIHSAGGGEPPVPNAIDAGTLADHLGELVEVSGTVEGWRGGHWYLNDGVESIFIYHDPESGVERPYLTRGEHRTVVGIVGASEKGPRLMPRFDSDLSAVGRSAAPRMSIANARAQPLDSRIEIEGVVVAAPGRFALTIAYIQDESGGIKLYRSAGFPAWVEGDRVRVVGYLKRSFGELELSLPQSSEVVRIGGGTPPAPRILGPGELSAHAGELVQVQGRVEGWRGAHWYLFDGRESLFIYHDRDTGVTRPYLTRNDIRTVVGIVGWSEAGPRLMPRYASDVGARGRYQSGGGGGTRPSDLPTTGRP